MGWPNYSPTRPPHWDQGDHSDDFSVQGVNVRGSSFDWCRKILGSRVIGTTGWLKTEPNDTTGTGTSKRMDGTIFVTDNQRPKLFRGWLKKCFGYSNLSPCDIRNKKNTLLWHPKSGVYSQNNVNHVTFKMKPPTKTARIQHDPTFGALVQFLRSPAPPPLLSQMTYLYSTTLPLAKMGSSDFASRV